MTWLIHYTRWHYGKAPQEMVRIWLNYLWFLSHFFSMNLLLKTLFNPFKRIQEERKETFNLQKIAETFAVNLMMRLVGFVLRSFVLLFGLIVITFFTLGGIFVFLGWILFPFVIVILLLLGVGAVKI